jgi:hypothetical protein
MLAECGFSVTEWRETRMDSRSTMIAQIAKSIPSELKDCSGAVFYSGRDAFSGIKDIDVLGLNPGGDLNKRRNDTIEKHTDEVLSKKPDQWSEYSCECWWEGKQYGERGKSGIQPSVIHLINKLGYDPCNIPASNVGFVRSRDEGALKEWCNKEGIKLDELFNSCWQVHREVIGYTQPKLILCMGRAAERVLRKKTNKIEIIHKKMINRRRYLVEVFRNERGCRLASVTHPSRGIRWTEEKSDPSDVVRQALEGADVRWSSVDVW